jgi:DNA-binding HxlR family transcriptional regulator
MFVERGVDAGPPVRVTYRLTAKGAGLREVMEAIDRWSRAHLTPTRKRRKAASG